jgi:transposase InsO family protein
LEINPGFEAKTLFGYLQRKYPGKFTDGQLRTLQRRVKTWRALERPPKEIFFPQEHQPGRLSQSDFTSMNELHIKIGGQRFNHLVYHFVLPYSNWEAGTICFSESFESLSEGLQNALWELGGVPKEHQIDRLSAAVCKTTSPEESTRRYSGLLRHYGIKGRKIQTGKPNENGDIEQFHYRFKKAVDQSLLLKGSRDFTTREEYDQFLWNLFKQLNAGRSNSSLFNISFPYFGNSNAFFSSFVNFIPLSTTIA